MAEENPAMFAPGQIVTLEVKEGHHSEFKIDRLITPITKSVVLLAHCALWGPVVLKVYDPRFINERNGIKSSRPGGGQSPRPWSLAAEPLWEAHLRRLMQDSFRAELHAYQNLRHLQGGALARLLGAGLVVPPDVRAFRPPALVFEYVEGPTLRDAPLEALTMDVCLDLARTVDSFAAHGVFHDDLNPNNILIGPGGRAVVLDFGVAGVRTKDDPWTDEEWALNVEVRQNGRRLRTLLKNKGVCCVGELEPRARSFDAKRGVWTDSCLARAEGAHIAIADTKPDISDPQQRLDRSRPQNRHNRLLVVGVRRDKDLEDPGETHE
ncbi:kinase-like domain-containing protein [Schizophyllum commune]